MSELAFDKEGNPFRFSRRTKKLRVRRFRNPGRRGTCETVLDASGEQLYIEPEVEFVEFRTSVGNVPGLYRLDQCDEDGGPIEDAPPGYVSIESTRNAGSIGDADPRDAIIRDLAQINADVSRTIAERFANVMQAAADILRAADGAGLPRRSPPPPAPKHDDDDDDDDDENDEEDDDADDEPEPSEKVWALIEQMMPTIRVWLASMAAKRSPSASPVAPPLPAPEPASTPAPAAVSSAVSAPGGVAAGPTAVADGPATPPAQPATATATAIVTAAGSSSTATPSAVSPDGDGVGPSTSTLAAEGTRNAPPVDPTPEQWSHLFAIRALLSPREAAIAEHVVARMTVEMRAQWLAELSTLTVPQAAEVVRSMIPKAAARTKDGGSAKRGGS